MDSRIVSPEPKYRLSDMARLYEQYIDHHAYAALGSDTEDDNGNPTKTFAYCICDECEFVIAMVSRGHAYLEARAAIRGITFTIGGG
jgi:hypothetical protein